MHQFENLFRMLAQEQVLGRPAPHLARHCLYASVRQHGLTCSSEVCGSSCAPTLIPLLGLIQLFIFSSLLGMKGNFITSLICNILITHEFKCLLRCFLAFGFPLMQIACLYSYHFPWSLFKI